MVTRPRYERGGARGSRDDAPSSDRLHGTVEDVAAPSFLDADGVKVWETLIPSLNSHRLLKDADLFSLGRYCQYIVEWFRMTEIINAEGFIVTTKDGDKRHPAVMVRSTVESALSGIEKTFGLNPIARVALFDRLSRAHQREGSSNAANKGKTVAGFLKEQTSNREG